MIHLFVDGDYFLTGMTPTSEEAVRAGVEDMLDAIAAQLFSPTEAAAAVEQRIVFFSSSVLKALEGQQSQRDVLITALRRLRFQTIVLDTISSRAGSPVDAAICTKTMSILAKAHGVLGANAGSGVGGGKPMTLVYVAANAYISSALEWAHDAGCGVCFVVYNGDSVADELMAYVSPTYGRGGGIATIAKGEGINFIPNTGAASAALAALQHEGKELPLAVLMQLKQLQQRLTGGDAPLGNTRNIATMPGTESSPSSVLLPAPAGGGAPLLPSVDALSRPHPPPIAGAPNPFLPDDDKCGGATRHTTATDATAPALSSTEELELDTLTTPGTTRTARDNATKPAHVLPAAGPTAPMSATAAADATKPAAAATAAAKTPGSVAMNTTPPLPHASTAMTDAQPSSTTDSVFPEPEVSTRLPAGWTLMYDRQRRRHYFVHTSADRVLKTTWTHPGGLEEQRELECQVENWYRKQQERCQAGANGDERSDHATSRNTRAAAEATAAATDWDECLDPKSGRKYYVNRQTKQTSWTLPTAVAGVPRHNPPIHAAEVRPKSVTAAQGTNALPPFWEECVDPKSGRKFYVNHQTRETTWTRPQLTPVTAPQPVPQPHTPTATHVVTPPPGATALPPFWEECVDPKTGRKFYVNHQTRETTWTRP